MTRFDGKTWLLAAFLTNPIVGCSPKAQGPKATVATPTLGDVEHQLPSGTRFTVARGWGVHAVGDGARVVGPEGRLVVHLVEATGDDPDAAIAAAWQARAPGFDRAIASETSSGGGNGWDAVRRVRYESTPEENRRVAARASTNGESILVVLSDLPADDAQRRQSELGVLANTIIAPGFTPERYAGRDPRPVDAVLLDELRDWVRRAQAASDTPGVAVALFDRDTVLLAEGFGVREAGQDAPVTANTPFLVASNTKPLTTLLLAKLADEGRFAWETPVTEVYPEFRLGDEATTAQVQMRHLVCACTGLPRRNNEWLFTYHDATPVRAVEALASMRPTTAFGELYQYSNELAAAAGYVGARAAFPDLEIGAAYDQAMQTRVFDPLGMSDTTFDFEAAEAAGAATPHAWNEALINVPVTNSINEHVRAPRPAGGAWSTVLDFARFGQLELAHGVLPDGTVHVSERNVRERHRPQVRIDHRSWYGMGLVVTDVKGVQVVSHGGSLLGFKSNFFLVPEAGVGGVVMANADIAWTLTSRFSTAVVELLYGDDTPESLADVRAQVRDTRAEYDDERATWQIPSSDEPAGRLARRYESDELGTIETRRADDGGLRFVTGGWSTAVATKANPDGTVSFVILEPGLLGFELVAGPDDGPFATLTLHDPQQTYVFRAAE